jgi:hypothetical protein
LWAQTGRLFRPAPHFHPCACDCSAEYCAPVWSQSAQAKRLNVSFHEASRTITGCIRCTQVRFLPALSGIKSLENRRINICENFFPLNPLLYNRPRLIRLRSRHPLMNLVGKLPEDLSIPQSLSDLTSLWSSHPPCHHLPRQQCIGPAQQTS